MITALINRFVPELTTHDIPNLISDVRFHGRRFIPRCIDRRLAKVQFRMYGLTD